MKEFIVLSERLGHCSPQSPVGLCIIMVERRRLTKTRHVIQIRTDFLYVPHSLSQIGVCQVVRIDVMENLWQKQISVRIHTRTELKGVIS